MIHTLRVVQRTPQDRRLVILATHPRAFLHAAGDDATDDVYLCVACSRELYAGVRPGTAEDMLLRCPCGEYCQAL